MSEMDILQIDAWAGDEPGTWEWNQWFHAGKTSILPKSVTEFIVDVLGGMATQADELYDIEDDQYNVILVNRETREPLFAVCYGGDYEWL